jgi:hypothetical protein
MNLAPNRCRKFAVGNRKGVGILNGSGLFLPVDVNVGGSAFWCAAFAIEGGI